MRKTDLGKYISGRKKRDAAFAQGFEEGYEKFKQVKSLLSLGGIAEGRKIGTGNERAFVKKIVARKISREGR
jgi:hypothetical protein